jgi:hypothetical protein
MRKDLFQTLTKNLYYFCIIYFCFISNFAYAQAGSGWSTCHAAGTTQISLTGRNSTHAVLVSKMTSADAEEYCNRAGLHGETRYKTLRSCVVGIMRNEGGEIRTIANCKIGTISVSTGSWSNSYAMPLVEMCGNDNMAAIIAFKKLCPSYRGQLSN